MGQKRKTEPRSLRTRRTGAAHAWQRLSGNGTFEAGVLRARSSTTRSIQREPAESVKIVRGMRSRAAGWIVALIAAAAVSGLATMSLESSFLYFPQRSYDALPPVYGLSADDVRLESSGGVSLRGWWIHGGGKRVLLYFHGNGGNISHRLDRTRRIVDALGLNVLLVDYRGYGASTGRPGEAGLYADGEAIYAAARSRGFEADRIVLFGESLGCAVAVEVARRHPDGAMILESPFLSVPAMARAHYPFVPSVLVRSRFDNAAKVGSLTMPKLIVCAERDEIVPPAQTRQVFDLASPPKRFFEIPGARHNDGYVIGGEAYLAVWRQFLEGESRNM